jgi:hypothetical protein
MKIYLAGSMPKGDEEEKNFDYWRVRYQKVLEKFFDAEFVDFYNRDLDESNSQLVLGTDCKSIKESDLVVVYAEEQMGAGGAQELVIAKYFKKPVVTVLPKNSYHRRSNLVFHAKTIEDWIHPFIFTFSDFIIESIDGIGEIRDAIFTAKIKEISVIDEAIEYVNAEGK